MDVPVCGWACPCVAHVFEFLKRHICACTDLELPVDELGHRRRLFLLALFYGQASGALTKTVELAERRYGADPAFHEYVASTPLIMPTPQSLARLLG